MNLALLFRRRPTTAVPAPQQAAANLVADADLPSVPPAPSAATRYVVTYSAVGPRGTRGRPTPLPLTVSATNRHQLADAIQRDVALYLDDSVHAVVDLDALAGQLMAGGHKVGLFDLTIIPAGDPR